MLCLHLCDVSEGCSGGVDTYSVPWGLTNSIQVRDSFNLTEFSWMRRCLTCVGLTSDLWHIQPQRKIFLRPSICIDLPHIRKNNYRTCIWTGLEIHNGKAIGGCRISERWINFKILNGKEKDLEHGTGSSFEPNVKNVILWAKLGGIQTPGTPTPTPPTDPLLRHIVV